MWFGTLCIVVLQNICLGEEFSEVMFKNLSLPYVMPRDGSFPSPVEPKCYSIL